MPRANTVMITIGMDDCKGCGTHLAYTPNIGEEAECPNCHTVHEIIDGGLLKLKTIEFERRQELWDGIEIQ